MAISSVTPVTAGSSVSEAAPAAPVQPAASATDDPQARFSGPAQFLGRLQELMKSDPAQAKQVLGNIAGKLRDQAKQAGADGGKLTGLADRFQRAADTGDLSAIRPTGGPHVSHSHHAQMMHHKAHAAYNATDADPMQAVLDNLSSSGGKSTTSST
jgi:hypothetical protein